MENNLTKEKLTEVLDDIRDRYTKNVNENDERSLLWYMQAPINVSHMDMWLWVESKKYTKENVVASYDEIKETSKKIAEKYVNEMTKEYSSYEIIKSDEYSYLVKDSEGKEKELELDGVAPYTLDDYGKFNETITEEDRELLETTSAYHIVKSLIGEE